MPVSLLPPITSSSTFGTPDADIHTTGLRYVRGGGMSRWHRVRSSYTYRTDKRTVYHLWCGQHASHNPGRNQLLLTVDEIGDGLPACGPCVGKALGAGQDEVPAGLPDMRFDPRWLTPPALCPGAQSSMHVELSQRVAKCLVCGELTPLRGYGGSPYYGCAGVGPTRHAPGPDLVEPCPWHAWRHLRLIGPERVGCGCGWHGPIPEASAMVQPSECPTAADHVPHPTGYVAHSAWADDALLVADQAQCEGCGGWQLWVPKRPDLRIAVDWPLPSCDWGGCHAEGVAERLSAETGEWLPVCAVHTGLGGGGSNA